MPRPMHAKLPGVNQKKSVPVSPRVHSLAKEERQWHMAVLIGTYKS